MTISTTSARVRYDGDGATTVFPIPFKFIEATHIKATLRDVNGGEAVWTLGKEYELSGAGIASGGSLAATTSPTDFTPQVGEILVIELQVPLTQQKAFPLGGAFPSTQVEEGFDLGVQRTAQLAEFDKRLLRVPATDARLDSDLELPLDSLRAGKYLGFDANGSPTLLEGTAEAADLSDKTVLPTGASVARTMADLFGLGALTAENVKLHGAKGDLVELADGTVTEGSAVLSSAGVTFDSADVGKVVWVEAAATVGKTITNVSQAPIDAAWQFDESAGTFVDLTADLNDAGGADVAPFPATEAVNDVFYVGHIQTFDKVTFDIATSGVSGVVAWEYWDGSAWQALTVTDDTSGFTAAVGNHNLSFTPPVDWAVQQINGAINGLKLFYVRARVTAVYTTNPVLDRATLDGGRIRVTVPDHKFQPGQTVSIRGVVGTTEANGVRDVEHIDPDTLDLIGPSFVNAYVSGGSMHGRLETTILSVAAGDANLAANAGASISGSAVWAYGTDDTVAIRAALATGKAVVVPRGNYLTQELEVAAEGQKFIGLGGRLIALPVGVQSETPSGSFVLVTGDFAEVRGLYLDNPTEQAEKGSTVNGWPESINRGIAVSAFQTKIIGNTVRRFRDGIALTTSSGFFNGPEYAQSIISGNLVWEVLGAGSGVDTDFTHSGEDRGDGITSWGAAAIITDNIVHVKRGADARIGLHCEGLSDRYDPGNPVALYVDDGCIIANNIVLAYGLDTRNGRWRRGITTEQVANVQIIGNSVYGGGWHAIQSAVNPDNKGANVAIVGNSVFWTRPQVDRSGQSFTPARAAIVLWANGADNVTSNIVVADNNVDVAGDCGDAYKVSSFVASAKHQNIRFIGNGSVNNGGVVSAHIRGVFSAPDVIIANNTFRGPHNNPAIRVQNPRDQIVISGNVVDSPEDDELLVQLSGGSAAITGNHFRGGSQGVHVINMDGVTISGNIVANTVGNAIDAFGTDNITITGNVLRNIGGSYIVNFTSGATKIDANNVKN